MKEESKEVGNLREVLNNRLKERYKNDPVYREKKKQIAINHYYTKKNSVNDVHIEIIKKYVVLYFF